MRTFLKTLLAVALIGQAPMPAHSAAVIFSGTEVKALKQNLSLNGAVKILSGTVTPTSSAVDAPAGSLYLNTTTAKVYKKTDAGSSTNWQELITSNLQGVASKTSAYTLTASDDLVLASASGAAFTLTLPAAASNTGKVYLIKKTDSTFNAVTVDGNASETIDGATTTTLNTQNESIEIVSDGTNWQLTRRNIPSVWASMGTPTYTAVNVGATGTSLYMWRRVGDSVQIRGQTSLAGAGADVTGTAIINPFGASSNLNGLTIDLAKGAGDSSSAYQKVGRCYVYESGGNVAYMGQVTTNNTSNTSVFMRLDAGTADVGAAGTTPFNWDAGDQFYIDITVPITGWKN